MTDSSEVMDCIICGKPIKSEREGFHKSHTVPQFCLDNIKAELNGNYKILTPSSIRPQGLLPITDSGVNKTGIFYLICSNCDSSKFQVYESEEALLGGCTRDMLDAIALKAYLKEFYDTTYNKLRTELDYTKLTDHELLKNYMSWIANIHSDVTMMNWSEFGQNIKIALKSFNNHYGNYKLIYYEVLDYKVPIAAQTIIPISHDTEFNEIQDVFATNPKPIEELIVCIFPLKYKSVVILFTQLGNRKLKRYIQQFKRLSRENKLKELFYLLIRYKGTNYYLSPLIQKLLVGDRSIQAIMSIEDSGIKTKEFDLKFAWFEEPRWKDELPNILLPEYSMQSLRKK